METSGSRIQPCRKVRGLTCFTVQWAVLKQSCPLPSMSTVFGNAPRGTADESQWSGPILLAHSWASSCRKFTPHDFLGVSPPSRSKHSCVYLVPCSEPRLGTAFPSRHSALLLEVSVRPAWELDCGLSRGLSHLIDNSVVRVTLIHRNLLSLWVEHTGLLPGSAQRELGLFSGRTPVAGGYEGEHHLNTYGWVWYWEECASSAF